MGEEMIRKFKPEQEGRIDYGEFIEIISKKMKNPFLPNDLMESFLYCDYDIKGYVTLQNLREASEEVGNNFGEEEEKMVLKYSLKAEDGSYYMNYEGFEKMMKGLKKDIYTCLGAFLQETNMDRGDPGVNGAPPFWIL